MHRVLSKIGLGLALALAASAATATATAWVYQNGPAFIIDQDSVVSGRASAELGGGASDGAGSYSYVGSAYADTRRGALGAAATANGVGYGAANDRLVVRSEASFSEAVTFSGSGPVTFRLAVQGNFLASNFGGQMSSRAELAVLGSGASPVTASTFWRGGNTRLNVSTNQTVVSALPSNFIVWLESTFSALAGVPYIIEGELVVFVTPPTDGSVQALFDHTAQLAIFTPDGVTFTSASGDFLSLATPAVPEPGTLATALAGLLMVALTGATQRRRCGSNATAAVCGS